MARILELAECIDLAKANEPFYKHVLGKLDYDGLREIGIDKRMADRLGKDAPQFEAQDSTLKITGSIWYWTMYRVQEFLRTASGDIEVGLASPGGDAVAGLAIYHMLRNYPHKVRTYAEGQVSSAAALVFLAGDRREMPEEGSATWMMHNVSTLFITGMYGNREELAALEAARGIGEADASTRSDGRFCRGDAGEAIQDGSGRSAKDHGG